MRIAIVRQRYNPFGGAERFVERAMAALAARGAQVTIIAREWQGRDPEQSRWLRCDPFHVGRTWRDASFAQAVCGATARAGFDLIQSHERLSCCDVYRAGDGVHRQWLDLRARSIGTLGRLAQACSPYHRYVVAAERRMFASSQLRAVICNSRMVRDAIVRYYGVDQSKLHVVYNGVDTGRFHPRHRESHRVAERNRLGIGEDAFVWLYVGSGFARKGVPTLIDAFARSTRGPADRLVIVGRDRHERRMRALAARLGVDAQVHLTGGLQDVVPLYAMADCLVLPTLYDPFPNVAVEALACGLPLVTTHTCGAAEIVRNGENGWVCDPLDPAGLAEAMTRVRAIDPERARAAARGSVAELSIEAMTDRLLALYERLLRADRG